MKKLLIMTAFLSAMLTGCERVDHTDEIHSKPSSHLPLDEVARMLSALPIEKVQMQEVHNAVSSSSSNGYDEEYMMRDIFASPGNGVGDSPAETKSWVYDYILNTFFTKHCHLTTQIVYHIACHVVIVC